VGGLFPRVAQEIKIFLGSQAVRGEFSLDGRPDCGRRQAPKCAPLRQVIAQSANND